jgi:hypothetical protein
MNLKLIITEAVGCVSDGFMNCVPGNLCPSFSSSGPHEPKSICGTRELFISNKSGIFFSISSSKCRYFAVITNTSQKQFDQLKGI